MDARRGLAAWPYTLQAAGTERAFTTPAMPSIAWEVSGTEAHLVSEMNAGHACAWGHGGDNGNIVVRATDQPSAEKGHREFVTTLEVGPAVGRSR